ncbi:MAG: DUF4298 domain-containing protein [Chitinophagaceae bacterium]|nr:MAG: DUF4298 domain-containing protein [Chitinophagaceae bacterium]
MDRVKKYNKILSEIEIEIREMAVFAEKLQIAQAKLDQLKTYYQTDWLHDFDAYPDQIGFGILSEDAVYNTIEDYHQKEKEILKLICNHL